MRYELSVNGQTVAVDVAPDTPMLWVLRDHLDLTGTKYGCGGGFCGACTIYVDGDIARSCQTPISTVADKAISTIEALHENHPKLVEVWETNNVPQCGYCQSGQLMAAAALLEQQRQSKRCRHRRRHDRQHLPLRHLHAHPRGHPRGRSLRRHVHGQ